MSDTDDSPEGRVTPWRYRLDARRFHGSLRAPERNETVHHESDDLAALVEIARGLVADGYTAWIYERVRRATPLPEAYDLRLVTQLDPGPAPG